MTIGFFRHPSEGSRQHGTTRLYVDQALGSGGRVELSSVQAHYLASVLRAVSGNELLLFNGRDGEWSGRIETLSTRAGAVVLDQQVRSQHDKNDGPWLAYAGAKRSAVEMMVQKATELGVDRILSVTAARSRPGTVKLDRLNTIAAAAAEQSGRLTVPEFRPIQKYDAFLASWTGERVLLMADETGAGTPLTSIFGAGATYCLFIGPEGGFTKTELDAAGQIPNLLKVDLGPRILRAETAAIAGLAILQSLGGDWRRKGERT